ncbi:cell division protein ZapB [Psychromonas sp. B3M02]|uniref:cell division protein ZapB n=1 Tax=unclassified Psychromonas TaxID=2614957 RepID=UPI000DEB10AD|nr:cell division protein ZapB [Psychromonas sp. B3M02]RBW41377.1 cell division protein ZapB [Psychromonas sp. B3M02]
MTFELLEKLENKINQAVETIALLQMEIEELKEDKANLAGKTEQLQSENDRLNTEHQQWQDRLSALVGKIDQAETNVD